MSRELLEELKTAILANLQKWQYKDEVALYNVLQKVETELKKPTQETDAERYRKLRSWMSSNVKEGWQEVERLGAIAAYVNWDEFDKYLDELPECNVGLCERRAAL